MAPHVIRRQVIFVDLSLAQKTFSVQNQAHPCRMLHRCVQISAHTDPNSTITAFFTLVSQWSNTGRELASPLLM